MLINTKISFIAFIITLSCWIPLIAMNQQDSFIEPKRSWYDIVTEGWYRDRELYKEKLYRKKQKEYYAEYIKKYKFVQNFSKNYQKRAHPHFIKQISVKNINDLTTIKSKLNELINSLKTMDSKKEFIKKEDIMPCKELWDKFLMLHNYNWLDHILYRYQPDILSADTAAYRRRQLLLLHPDKSKFSNDNNDQYREDLFKHITNIERPTKPLDFIVNPTISIITPIGIRTSMLTAATVCSLPSLLFPNYFKNKESLHLEKLIKKEKIELTQYNIAIKDHDIEIKDYNNAIKVAEFKNKMYQQEIKDILKSLN